MKNSIFYICISFYTCMYVLNQISITHWRYCYTQITVLYSLTPSIAFKSSRNTISESLSITRNILSSNFSHVLWLQVMVYPEQLLFVSETIGRTWERIQFAIVSPVPSKKGNLFFCPVIHLCLELSFPYTWKQLHRHQFQCNFHCVRPSCTLIRYDQFAVPVPNE